jgi:hypothetical protein
MRGAGTSWTRRGMRACGLCGLVSLLSVGASGQQQQQAGTSASPDEVIATGCVRDVREIGGQGGGGAAWQGSVTGHLLADVRIASAGPATSSPPAAAETSASGNVSRDPAPSVLLIQGIQESELRRLRGQQVELRGVVGPARQVSRGSNKPKGNEGAGAPSTPNGRVAGEKEGGAPAIGTGGTLRVPASPSPGGVTEMPRSFEARSIRALSRTCPAGAR